MASPKMAPSFLSGKYFRIPSLVSWAWQLGCLTVILSSIVTCQDDGFEFKVGAGKADVTGASVEIGFMGYANPDQKGQGIHMRLYSRAFVIEDRMGNRVVYVTVEAGMTSQLVRTEVIEKLQEKYKGLYNDSNVCISSTHTHSGPGGYLQFVLFQITNLGFHEQTFDALVTGILLSIDRAHDNVRPANILLASGDLVGSNLNRSPFAYEFNPTAERQRYARNTDTLMTLLKIVGVDGEEIGMINWFAVHPTSMNNTNKLVSSDNKGYAAQVIERRFNTKQRQAPFVAAFANSNLGDVSPNIKGPICIDTGLPCNYVTSQCGESTKNCIASGPGRNMYESARIIGQHQADKALELWHSANKKLKGRLAYRHQFLDMTRQIVKINSTHSEKTCKPAMGMSFAAGTIDGAGAFDFTQGDTKGNPFWNFVKNLFKKPSNEQKKCHGDKPILVDSGEMSFPYMWQPDVVDIQMISLGSLAILAVPGEFTTMSGRRLRERVVEVLKGRGAPGDTTAVVAGLSNSYSDYITTCQEYEAQRYEGASTIYGPNTLEAYIQNFERMADNLATDRPVDAGPRPANLKKKQMTFILPVYFDTAPFGVKYGQNLKRPATLYKQGDTVSVEFQAGNPRNDLMLESSYLSVERFDDGSWTRVYSDADWETKFIWRRKGLSESRVTAEWKIPREETAGQYRICHFGHRKDWLTHKIIAYSGCTPTFDVNLAGTIVG